MWFVEVQCDENVADKLWKKHAVDVEEVREALPDSWIRRAPNNRYRAYGRTAAGRYLFMVLAPGRGPVVRIVTARDMTDSESRVYQRR